MPDHFYFISQPNGEIDIYLNGKKAPSLEKLQAYKKALEEYIKEYDETEVAEYNKWVEEQTQLEINSNKEPEQKPKIPGVIYILKTAGLYKIGRTKNLTNRLKKYVTENPHPIEVVHTRVVEDYVQTESQLHNLVGHLKVRGEWYSLSDLQRDLVISELNKI